MDLKVRCCCLLLLSAQLLHGIAAVGSSEELAQTLPRTGRFNDTDLFITSSSTPCSRRGLPRAPGEVLEAQAAVATHRPTRTFGCTAAFPKAPAQPGSSGAADSWPGAYTGGPEATIWRRPVILLLGDSITQMGSNEYDGDHGGWVAHMQAHYNRKVWD